MDYVIEQLKKIDAVKYVQGVFGTFDIIIKVEVDVKNIFTKISLLLVNSFSNDFFL